MRIRRLNEKIEPKTQWHYEIREDDGEGGFWYVDPWDNGSAVFDEFDWDSVNVSMDPENSNRNLDLYVEFMVYLKLNHSESNYKLVKVIIEEVTDEQIDMISTSTKYNI